MSDWCVHLHWHYVSDRRVIPKRHYGSDWPGILQWHCVSDGRDCMSHWCELLEGRFVSDWGV